MKCKKFLCLAALPFLLASCDLSQMNREEANRMLQDIINNIETNKDELSTSSYSAEVYLYDDNNTVSGHAIAQFNDEDHAFFGEITGAGVLTLMPIPELEQVADKLGLVGQTYTWIEGNTVYNYDYVKAEGIKYEGQNEYKDYDHVTSDLEAERIEAFEEYTEIPSSIDIYEANAFLVNEILNPIYFQEKMPNVKSSYISKADGSISAHIVNKDQISPIDLYVDIVDYKVVGAKGKVDYNGESCIFDLTLDYGIPQIVIPEDAKENKTIEQ